jgi:hypothetical protein
LKRIFCFFSQQKFPVGWPKKRENKSPFTFSKCIEEMKRIWGDCSMHEKRFLRSVNGNLNSIETVTCNRKHSSRVRKSTGETVACKCDTRRSYMGYLGGASTISFVEVIWNPEEALSVWLLLRTRIPS